MPDQRHGEEQARGDEALALPNRPALRIMKRANGAVRAFHTHGDAEVRLAPDSPRPPQGSIRVTYRCPACPRAEPIVMLPQERAE
jgi:hypothetical protein